MYEIPVFFSSKMVAPDQGVSPSAHKPAAVVADWVQHRFPLRVVEPAPVSREQIALAHSTEFVEEVLALRRENGFGNRSAAVAATLRYTSGAMLAAARAAMRNGRVAVAPVSGFHHACYASAGGFCTFNGLMVTACVLCAEGAVQRVGILDFDLHYGNGTEDIVRVLGARWIRHLTAGRSWRSKDQANEFLRQIPAMVEAMNDCDVILYQAGVDPHINDPYGGWMTTEQLAERDQRVFDAAAGLGIPVAWNLAGGYQRSANGGIEPMLEIHRNTMFACFRTYVEAARRSRVEAGPLVRPEELVFDANNPLSYEQQRDLLRRMQLHERMTGERLFFPDLQRLPIDVALDADEPPGEPLH
jgi:acetoin utilization deacetylase AcuC-like enzyme